MGYDNWKMTSPYDAREDAERREARRQEIEDLKDRWPSLARLVAWMRRNG